VTQDWVGTLDVPIHAISVISPKPQAQDATPSLDEAPGNVGPGFVLGMLATFAWIDPGLMAHFGLADLIGQSANQPRKE
jgi:hypothetical protein